MASASETLLHLGVAAQIVGEAARDDVALAYNLDCLRDGTAYFWI